MAVAARGAPNAFAPDWLCCNLATSTWCAAQGYGNFVCPQGFVARRWYCCQGSQLIGCGECTSGPSCYDWEWVCSYGYNTGVVC